MSDFLQSLLYNPRQPLMFTSVLFFVLFGIFYAFYALYINKIKTRNVLLLLFSLFFYYKVSGYAVILLVLMATSDFFIGKAIAVTISEIGKRRWVWLSVAVNLGSLFFFKYFNFLVGSLFGQSDSPTLSGIDWIVLPIGISFYVFKSLSYIFDLQREVIEEPEKSYVNYLLYVSFFPNIMAGPIAKARDLLPQLNQPVSITQQMVGRGFFLILIGAFLKVFVSDYIAANFVDRVYNDAVYFGGFENLMATYGAFIWVYADFAGYTNIVVGLALLMGYTVQHNFKQPFAATNVTDFWRRWHITLAQWFNDYLFYPLNYTFRRYAKWGIMLAVFITFMLSGLWHGPRWNFVIWGILHGIALSWDVLTQDWRDRWQKHIPARLYRFLSVFITFHFLMITVVLFKTAINNLNNPDVTADIEAALTIYRKIFTEMNWSVAAQWAEVYKIPMIIMGVAMILHYIPQKIDVMVEQKFTSLHWSLKAVVFALMIVVIYQTVGSDTLPFIYLDF